MKGARAVGMMGLPTAAGILSLLATYGALAVSAQGQPKAWLQVQEATKGAEHTRRKALSESWTLRQVAPSTAGPPVDVGECILLFGAFLNGNMGDVVQHISMEHLLSSVAPNQCFYYGHSGGENFTKGFRIGEFFGGDRSKIISLFTDMAWQVNKFKAFVIGGGGIFSAKHAPLFKAEFADAITVPIIVMGVGANYQAKEYGALLKRAAFVSGRDKMSIKYFSSVLGRSEDPVVSPEDVAMVRDPVLSDKSLTDTDGRCWKQSKGGNEGQVCFVLPAADTTNNLEMHRVFRTALVSQGDRFINVFPKHQEEIEKLGYPGKIEEILDPMLFKEELCSCKAIITTRFHGIIFGLHMGVPVFGAYHEASANKVPDLIFNAMEIPDQFLLIDENITRRAVDFEIDTLRQAYDVKDRRGSIHARLSQFNEEFTSHAHHVLFDVIGVEDTEQKQPQQEEQGQEEEQHEHFEQQAPQESSQEDAMSTQSSPLPVGEEYIISVLLLFTILGLALLPSTVDGSGNLHPKPSENSDLSTVQDTGVQKNRVARTSHALKTTDPEGLITEGTAKSGRSRDFEQGLLDERSKSSSQLISSHKPPRQDLSRGRCMERRQSEAMFALNFVLWIGLAVMYSTYSKHYLKKTHDPIGLLILQGTSGAVILFSLEHVKRGASGAGTLPSRLAMLAALLHAGQALLTNYSLSIGGVAITNALKAMEPVAAAVFSYILLRKSSSLASMFSFATIAVGIWMLTSKGRGGGNKEQAQEPGDGGGESESDIYSRVVLSAIFTISAVCCNALRNVFIKKSDPVPPQHTLFSCSVAAGAMGVALMLFRVMVKSMEGILDPEGHGATTVQADAGQSTGGFDDGGYQVAHAEAYGSWLSMDGINAALCFVGYNFASFNLLARLSPVGHAIGNSVKRVVMFASGMIFLGEVLTSRQLSGAACALAGVMIYNIGRIRK